MASTQRSPKHDLADTALAVRLLGITSETLLGTKAVSGAYRDRELRGT